MKITLDQRKFTFTNGDDTTIVECENISDAEHIIMGPSSYLVKGGVYERTEDDEYFFKSDVGVVTKVCPKFTKSMLHVIFSGEEMNNSLLFDRLFNHIPPCRLWFVFHEEFTKIIIMYHHMMITSVTGEDICDWFSNIAHRDSSMEIAYNGGSHPTEGTLIRKDNKVCITSAEETIHLQRDFAFGLFGAIEYLCGRDKSSLEDVVFGFTLEDWLFVEKGKFDNARKKSACS